MNKFIKQHCLTLLTSLYLFTLPVIAWAEQDVEKIFLSAYRMEMNINTGVSVYTGDVKISQKVSHGKLVLTGDKVTLKRGEEGVERITITGTPARYNHVTATGQSITAQSEHMVYIAGENKLIMTINAYLLKPDLKLSSHKIVYDTQQQTVIAGDGDKVQRVNITITPKR